MDVAIGGQLMDGSICATRSTSLLQSWESADDFELRNTCTELYCTGYISLGAVLLPVTGNLVEI